MTKERLIVVEFRWNQWIYTLMGREIIILPLYERNVAISVIKAIREKFPELSLVEANQFWKKRLIK